jgi:acyl-CoA thioester hydrolase
MSSPSRDETPAAESRVRVRYAETDAMGVAHHAEYLAWFEVGRTDWMRERGEGRSYRRLEQAGWMLPVVELGARYSASAKYDDEVAIVTRLESASRARFVFEYDVLRLPDRARLATGRTVHAVVDRSGRAARMPQALLDWVMGVGELPG